jgi:hypothetical protein
MIAWSVNTCAHVIYGPIAGYYDNAGQMFGRLGFPMSDVLPADKGASYAVFENGVVWAAADGGVTDLRAWDPDQVRTVGKVDVTAAGITELARQQIQNQLNVAIQRPDVSDKVKSAQVAVKLRSVGGGGCRGASFNAGGRSLLRSHTFEAFMMFDVKGCWGTFGDAQATVAITIRLFTSPPIVQAFMESYNIESVGSPFGGADEDLRDALRAELNTQYGKDLLAGSVTFPRGAPILAAVVDRSGNVNIFTAPVCGVSSTVRSSRRSNTEDLLRQLRAFREDDLRDSAMGEEFVSHVEMLGPLLADAISREPDAGCLGDRVVALLERLVADDEARRAVVGHVPSIVPRLELLMAVLRRREDTSDHLAAVLAQGVTVIREALADDVDVTYLVDLVIRELESAIRAVAFAPSGTLGPSGKGPDQST